MTEATAPQIDRFSALGFKPAGTGSRFCKFGIYGPQGSGKTTTMTYIARELAIREKKKKAYMIDSEDGGDYVESIFKAAGITLELIKTREFGRLIAVFEAMHASGEVLLIDSITHFWNDVVETFVANKKGPKTIRVQDWGTIFETWRKFTKPYVTSSLHALVCARMGYEYATIVNEAGQLEFYKTDTKFKAGDQFGHEPSVLIHMEQVDNVAMRDQLASAKSKEERARLALLLQQAESSIDFVATVEKDRSRLLMGKQFVFHIQEDGEKQAKAVVDAFDPVIAWHIKQGAHRTMEETGATKAMLTPGSDEWKWQEELRMKGVYLEEIKATFNKYFSTSKSDHKKAAIEVSEQIFGVKSFAAIEQMDLATLKDVVMHEAGKIGKLESACMDRLALLTQAVG